MSLRDNHEDLHARLCAYLLDELPDDERASIERALADDADLRAAKERLAATIHTVRGAFPAGDALSDTRRAALIAAAEGQATVADADQRRGFLHLRSLAVALAAGVLVTMAVFLARGPEPGPAEPAPVARAPAGESTTTLVGAYAITAKAGDKAADVSAVDRIRALPETSAPPPNPTPATPGPVDVTSDAFRAHINQLSLGTDVEPDSDTLDQLRARIYHAYREVDGTPDFSTLDPSVLDQYAVDSRGLGDADAPDASAIDRLYVSFPQAAVLPAAEPGPLNATDVLRFFVDTAEVVTFTADPQADPGDEQQNVRLWNLVTDGSAEGAVGYCHITAADILAACRRRPQETPAMMYFRFWGDNPFVLAGLDNLSTFGVDVDTASYALARNYLKRGLIPEKAQIRTEEFVNYFKADVPPPESGTFAVNLEIAPSLFGGDDSGRWLLRVALRAREIPRAERQSQNLTFVVDTSGSMKEENRIELVKHALRLLLTELDGRDRIAIVRFSDEAHLCLPLTSVAEGAKIEQVIHGLTADGSTNAGAGLVLGYEQAAGGFDSEAVNRVVLLSDGVANTGVTDQAQITASVADYRAKGIYLNTVGVGMGNHNDVLLEQLADQGDGLCNYVDTPAEAKRALVDNFTGAFIPVARDVKIQVEFDQTRVLRYRLLGYENRAIADADFRNDRVDAGEVGSGHQVCALYEIDPGSVVAGEPAPIATVRVRYKPPFGQGDEVTEIERTVDTGAVKGSYEEGSAGYRRSVLVAQFAEFLRRSSHAAGDSLDLLVHEATKLDKELSDPDFSEFLALADAARTLIVEKVPADDPLIMAIDAVQRNAVLRAELEELSRAEDQDLIRQLEDENQRLEQKIEELLKRRLEGG